MAWNVAVATAAEVPDLDEDGPPLVRAFDAAGMRATPVVWDADVDWSAFDAILVRCTWDYPTRRAEFLEWARRVDRGSLWNSGRVLRWNTDKTYLRPLAAAGVPIVPTTWVEVDADAVVLPRGGEYVVKPAISAGSKDTVRYRQGDDAEAAEHVRLIQASGRAAMVQPYVPSVDDVGEIALMYIDGRFSHAVRKGALLSVGQGFVEGLYAAEDIVSCPPSAAERAVAGQVMTAAHEIVGDLLYARVDLVEGHDGRPLLLELELTEPSLFLAYDDGAAGRLAAAVRARLR